MANSKITDLTLDATPTVDDLVLTVNDPAGTPVSRKSTLGTLPISTPVQTALDGKAALSHTQTASTITDFSTAADARIVAASLAPQLIPTAVKTTSYTATPNDFVPADTTSGSVAITLPTAPANGTRFGAKMILQGGTNTTTITCGGTDVFNKVGGSTSLSLSLLNQSIQFQYQSGIWYGMSADIGLSALDARFQRNPSTITTVSSATPSPTGDFLENELYVTASTVGMTVAAPSGTPANGNKLNMAFFTAAAQTLAFNAIFAPVGVTLPTTTVAGKWTYVSAKYNATASKWHVLAVGQEA